MTAQKSEAISGVSSLCERRGNELNLALAFGVERVLNDELTRQNLVIGQAQRAETERNPTEPFAGGVWLGWMRIRRPHDLREQVQRGILQLIFLHEGSSSICRLTSERN